MAADKVPGQKQMLVMVADAWGVVRDFVTELQAEFGFRADPDKQEECRRKVQQAFEIPLCKKSLKDGRPCPNRASKGGYCGTHSKARRAEEEAEIFERVHRQMPKHDHGFGAFSTTCPACRLNSCNKLSTQV